MERGFLIFDMGGTSIKVAMMTDDGQILEKGKIDTGDSFENCMDIMVQELTKQQQKYHVEGISISAPGAVDAEDGVIGGCSALPFIHGPNWKKEWKKRTGYEIAIENDATCAALSELYYGNAKDCKNFVYVVIGTGIGGAVVIDRKIVKGTHLHGGEFGYLFLPFEKAKGYQSWSALGSSVATERRYKADHPNNPKSAIEIFDAADQGDATCQVYADDFYLVNALGVQTLQFVTDPELILFGGGITRRENFEKNLQKQVENLQQYTEAAPTPKVRVGRFMDDANIYGALANLLFI